MKKANTMFLLVYVKILRLLFWFLFSFKNIKLVHYFYFLFYLNFVSIFEKIMQFCHFR